MRPKKRLRIEEKEDEEEEKEVEAVEEEQEMIATLVEGLKEIAGMLGQRVNPRGEHGEVLDDVDEEIKELGKRVEKALAIAGHSARVCWLDHARRRPSKEARGGQPDEVVKS